MDFNAFTEDIINNKWKVHGVEVYKGDELIHSFGNTTDIYPIYSCTKSVFSIALGIAYDRGLIDFSKSIFDYIPMDVVEISEEKRSIYSKLPLERFMTMSVEGFPFRPESDNYLKETFTYELKNPEIPAFDYSNFQPYLVSVALTHAIGMDVGEFIEENVFKPMEIKNYKYTRSPEGYFYSPSKMELSVHDLSKFGIMLKDKGVYNGHRIISEEYTQLATSVRQMNREGGYGYYIWKYREGFSINGKWKQKCYVLPDRDLIITYLADIRDTSHDLLHSMENNILDVEENNKTIVRCSVSD